MEIEILGERKRATVLGESPYDPENRRLRKLSRTAKVIVFALAGWSGFFVMAVELLSGRVLAPSFGNSIYVWGAVITVFMLALAVGYLAGGQISMFSPSLRRLGALLIAAGLATLPVVLFGNAALDWIFDRVADPRYGSLLASALLFFVPTAISGAVSPYAVRLLVSDLHASGKSAGSLYFVSTFGSAAGTILTSFYLVLLFEVNTILLGLMMVSIVLGLLAVLSAGAARVEAFAQSWSRRLLALAFALACVASLGGRRRAAHRALALSQHRRRRGGRRPLHEVRTQRRRTADVPVAEPIPIVWCSTTRG